MIVIKELAKENRAVEIGIKLPLVLFDQYLSHKWWNAISSGKDIIDVQAEQFSDSLMEWGDTWGLTC